MRIAVIDDERPARSELKHQLLEILPDAVVDEGDSGARALELAGEYKYELFFLDINLGDINGTVLVHALKNMQPDMKIIFVTAYSEYAVKAYELGVEDYVMKPFSTKRLQKVISRLQEKPALNTGSAINVNSMMNTNSVDAGSEPLRRIAISSNGKTIFEDVADIVYIETYNRGCKIYTVDNAYQDSKTIGEYEKKLGEVHFFRIHKSYLINLDKVREVFPWGNNSFSLRMKGYEDNILPISREKTKLLRQMLEY
jgi:DNA-binding LytR/AlgR family response regulator